MRKPYLNKVKAKLVFPVFQMRNLLLNFQINLFLSPKGLNISPTTHSFIVLIKQI